MIEERFETFVNSVSRISKALMRLKNQNMQDLGLKGTHVMILFQLSQHPEGLASARLSELTGEDKAAISRSLVELQKKELVSIPEGRYRANITLTAGGKAVTEKMDLRIIRAVDKAARGYSEEERAVFYKVLLKVASNLENAAMANEEKK